MTTPRSTGLLLLVLPLPFAIFPGCDSGGGGGAGPTAPLPSTAAVQIGGPWTDSTSALTAVSGSTCYSRTLRSRRLQPFDVTLSIEQTGGEITRFFVTVDDDDDDTLGPWTGTIDSEGTVTLEFPSDLLPPGQTAIVACSTTPEFFDVELLGSRMTGSGATGTELTLVQEDEWRLSRDGVVLDEITLKRRIEASR